MFWQWGCRLPLCNLQLITMFIALTFVEIKLSRNWIWTGTFVAVLTAEKLEWGNHDHLSNIIEKHPVGFDLILGADIYILLTFLCPCGYFQFSPLFSLFLMHISIAAFRGPWLAESFQQSSIPCLFDTVEKLLRMLANKCRFILAYVSRAKVYVLFQLIIYVFSFNSLSSRPRHIWVEFWMLSWKKVQINAVHHPVPIARRNFWHYSWLLHYICILVLLALFVKNNYSPSSWIMLHWLIFIVWVCVCPYECMICHFEYICLKGRWGTHG